MTEVVCRNGHPQHPTVVRYNANGYERYCTTCGTQLNGPERRRDRWLDDQEPEMALVCLCIAILCVGIFVWQVFFA